MLTTHETPIGLALLAVLAGTAHAATIQVPGDYASLHDAVQAAQNGDEIVVGPGEHAGGFTIGKSIIVRSSEGPERTTLVGPGEGPVVALEAGASGGGSLVGFTVTNGAGQNGGGLFLSGDVAVIDCTVTGNSARNGGGAFLVGSPVLSDVRFHGNQADHGGGVFLSPDANAILDVCDFFDNNAVSGGAVYVSPRGSRTTFATIGAGTFDDNSANDGGAIYARMAGFDIVEASFVNNYAAGRGASIYAADGEFSSVAAGSMKNGEASEGGAVFLEGFGEFRIQDCEITGNESSDWDAAISVRDGHALEMQGTTVWGNSPEAISGEWSDLGSNSFEAPRLCEVDYAQPFGVLDVSDVMAWIDLFVARDEAADLEAPFGMLDLRDITAFVNRYYAGCE